MNDSENQTFPNIPSLPAMQHPEDTYSEEYFVHKASLYFIQSQESLEKTIQSLPLTQAAKSGFENLIHSLFDSTSILARLDNIDLSLTDAEILINTNVQNLRPSDRKLAMVANIEQTILMIYRMALTRAVGGFEIQNQHKTSMGEQTIKQVLEQSPRQNPERGWGLSNPLKKR